MKSILVDIDHTISNAFWRDNMINTSSWDEYHKASEYDQPLHDIIELLQALRGKYNMVGITARPEKFRDLTMKWCLGVRVPLDELLMRPDEAYHPSPEVKRELLMKRFLNPLREIAFVLEDRDDCCTMFRGLGLTVLQVYGRRQ